MENKKENLIQNALINIFIPIIVLNKLSDEKYLGPVNALIVSVLIPLSFGIYELIRYKKTNFISIIGLISIALTGALGLLKLPPQYVAIKEAMIPFIIGVVVLVLVKTRFSLFNKILYSNQLVEVEKIEDALDKNNKKTEFQKVLVYSNVFLAMSFFLSAILNYVLAVVVVKSQPGTIAYNNELADMQLYSYPVIFAPSIIVLGLILFYFFGAIKKLTGLTSDEIMKG